MQRRHHTTRHSDITTHTKHNVGLTRPDDGTATKQSGKHFQSAGQHVQQTLTTQAGEINRVEQDAARRHNVSFHATLCAKP